MVTIKTTSRSVCQCGHHRLAHITTGRCDGNGDGNGDNDNNNNNNCGCEKFRY
jgi:hypothetical protein